MTGQDRGRINQKARTRAALLGAAVAMLRGGQQPTVDDIAQATGISKRTAYRYFASQEHLLADAALEALHAQVAGVLDATERHDEPWDRLDALIRSVHDLTVANERELLTMMRLALDARLARAPAASANRLRGRRIDWIEAALAPLQDRLDPTVYRRLVSALTVCIGIDAYLVLRDIRRLSDSEAVDVVRWMARTLLKASLPEGNREAAGPPLQADTGVLPVARRGTPERNLAACRLLTGRIRKAARKQAGGAMERPSMFGRTLQETDIWLKELQQETSLFQERQAYAALRAVLHQLRDRLTVEESAHLAAQLPTLIRGIYFEGWKPAAVPERVRHKVEFLEGVRAKAHDLPEINPEEATRAVFGLLRRHIAAGEIDDVIGQLPRDLQELWPEPPTDQPSPSA